MTKVSVIAAMLTGLLVTGCGRDATAPTDGPTLPAHTVATPGDTTPTTPAPNGEPGSLHGVVVGSPLSPPGADSASSEPRLANITVTIYKLASYVEGVIVRGDQVATTTTDANGVFSFPPIDAGQYAIDFVPIEPSVRSIGHMVAVINGETTKTAWTIVLGVRSSGP